MTILKTLEGIVFPQGVMKNLLVSEGNRAAFAALASLTEEEGGRVDEILQVLHLRGKDLGELWTDTGRTEATQVRVDAFMKELETKLAEHKAQINKEARAIVYGLETSTRQDVIAKIHDLHLEPKDIVELFKAGDPKSEMFLPFIEKVEAMHELMEEHAKTLEAKYDDLHEAVKPNIPAVDKDSPMARMLLDANSTFAANAAAQGNARNQRN